MIEPRQQKVLLLIATSIILLMLLSAGLHEITLNPGRPFRFDWTLPVATNPRGTTTTGTLPGWLGPLTAFGLVASLIGMIVSKQLRRDLIRNLPALLLFCLGIYLIGQTARNWNRTTEQALPPPPLAAEPDPGAATATAAIPSFITNPPEAVVIGITLLIVAGLIALIVQIIRRNRPQPTQLERIVEEAREALAELRAGADLRDTISRCYADMVTALREERGMGRDLTLTPREFEQRLAAAGLDDDKISRLTRLFERVRYSPHAPGSAEEQEAEACLEAIIRHVAPHTGGPQRGSKQPMEQS
ncbi:MAG: hypothetical protein Fur005_28620 [Roseiflexaceae bacterium]